MSVIGANGRMAAVRARVAAAVGRLSLDHAFQFAGFNPVILPPPDAEQSWRMANLDTKALDRAAPGRLLELLIDLSPDVSRAIWDLLRLLNPGIETFAAYRPGTEEVDQRAQTALDAIRARLNGLYGTMNVPINRLFIAALLRGAFLAELVADEAGRVPLDLATPDPISVRFQRVKDPERGDIWQAGQLQGARFVPFDRPTIRYIPIDPLPGSPYGRAPAAAALFPALFLIGLLHDLRRVVAQQGYPRLDIEIDLDALKTNAPPEAVRSDGEIVDYEKFADWVNEKIGEIEEVYARLQPDEAFIHTNAIKVNRPVGAVDSSSLGAVGGLIEALERMLLRALKTMPLLMGITDGVSEANANRQWEILAAAVKALQHPCEALLEHLFGLGLQMQGFQATVRVRFAELRAAEMQRDAQTEQLLISNARTKYDHGWISHEAAAKEGADVDKPDALEPRARGGAAAPDAAEVNPEPGSDRALGSARTRATEPVTPEGAGDPLDDVPDEVTFSAADKRRILATWDTAMPDHAGLLDAEVVNADDEG